MIGAVSESPANPKLYANANTKDERMEEVFEHDMELDDYSPSGKNTSEMGVEEEAEPVKNPLAAAVEYAQALRIEFEADKRPEIRIALEESFSLVAYQDPKNSVLAHLFDEDGRIAVAEELNSAILGKQIHRCMIFILGIRR